jgi:hypothetical protein
VPDAYLKASNPQSNAYFGGSTAIDLGGGTLALGPIYNGVGFGSAYVFTR